MCGVSSREGDVSRCQTLTFARYAQVFDFWLRQNGKDMRFRFRRAVVFRGGGSGYGVGAGFPTLGVDGEPFIGINGDLCCTLFCCAALRYYIRK